MKTKWYFFFLTMIAVSAILYAWLGIQEEKSVEIGVLMIGENRYEKFTGLQEGLEDLGYSRQEVQYRVMNAYIANKLKYQWAKQVNFYDEKAAGFKSAYTGKFFEGVPVAEEIKKYDGEVYKPNKPLQFINWKSRNMATHRTEGNTWLREIKPENYLWINPTDARKKGIHTDDEIYIVSSSAKVKGRALVTPGIKPGVVGANFSFGHSAYGSKPVKVDGKTIQPAGKYGHTGYEFNRPLHEESGLAKQRGLGFSVNALTERDGSYFEGFLADLLVGGPAQQDVFVDVEKA